MVIVQQLRKQLPPGYVAEPRVPVDEPVEIRVSMNVDAPTGLDSPGGNGSVATSVWTISPPAVAIDTDSPDEPEYEVRVYDVERDRLLVAAIELVSPANKDRPETREAFVNKCATLLRHGVAVSIIDLVTHSHFNLYAQLMHFIRHPDRTMALDRPEIYAASCRWPTRGTRARLEAWSHTLVVGEPLPPLPLWLSEDRVVPLNLDRVTNRLVTTCGSSDVNMLELRVKHCNSLPDLLDTRRCSYKCLFCVASAQAVTFGL